MSTLPGGIHWVRLLFLTFFLLGIDSAFSFIEAEVACCRDTVFFRNTPKIILTAFICSLEFLMSILYATDAGLNFLDVIDYYINYVMLIIGFFESFGLGWVYNIEEQISKFGAPAVFTYMVSSLGSVLFACIFWFGVENQAPTLTGFIALFLFQGIGILITTQILKPESSFIDLAFGNMRDFKSCVEPVIGYVPTAWCFLIKHFVPQVILVYLVNLGTAKNEDGMFKFGNYSGLVAAPYQVIGILTFVFTIVVVLIGVVVPDLYFALDTHADIYDEKVEDSEEKEVERKDDKIVTEAFIK